MSDPAPSRDQGGSPVPTMSVWQIYRSRFIYTQAFILFACGAVYLYRRNLPLVLAMLFFLQLAAIYGSWMGKRMLDRLRENQ